MLKRYYLIIAMFLLASCASHKKVLYLQDLPVEYSKQITNRYDVRIQPSDLLSIVVTSKNLELSQIFNLMPQSNLSTNRTIGFTVDNTGCINFPQLGRLSVEDKTRVEVEDFIAGELRNKGYVNDAIVTVQILNYKVSVLGEVVRPGTINVSTDCFTILDAIANAGDLTIYGKRNNVKVIREEKGVRTVEELDLRKSDLLDSPYFYLRQNDVVYVEPNNAKTGQREINQNRSIGTFASIVSVILSVISLIK